MVFELKKGRFKTAYLAQLSTYLRILNDEDRREGGEAPIGIILCKSVDRPYVEYIMQDFRQPMGVATYKTADEIDPDLLKALPPKEELERLLAPEGGGGMPVPEVADDVPVDSDGLGDDGKLPF